MKKLVAIVAITMSLTSCGSGNSDTNNESSATAADSVKRASDSVMQTGDTSALNRQNGDTVSKSSNSQSSGSKAGGGNTGGTQGKKGK